MQSYQSVLDFWFGEDFFARSVVDASFWPDATHVKRWFASTRADDALMAEQFGDLVETALEGGFVAWEEKADTRLALILLLDQLPRNIFRGTARAFAGDTRAAALAQSGVENGLEKSLPIAAQVFFYMPLMHAENLAQQTLCGTCFAGLQERAPLALKAGIGGNLRFAHEHRQIIERFGRFPHRNAALGRTSTVDELEFLEHANRYGQ